MSREKGTIKTGGRAKGTPNKITKNVREFLFEVVQNNMPQLENDIQQLEPKERWQIVSGLLPYIVTKKEVNHSYRWEFSEEEWGKQTQDITIKYD